MKQHVETSQSRTSSTGILVGNKNDLSIDRCVSYEEAYSLAETLRLPFCEISVKDGDQLEKVADIFRVLYRFWRQREDSWKNAKLERTISSKDEGDGEDILVTKEKTTVENLSRERDNIKESVTSPMKKMKLVLFQRFTRPRLPSL